ncbi:MAG: rhodanese-like domain-containing protein [Blastocatellia bacterium]
MFFKQFYLGCLAHASYLIGSEGEAAVVDPQRDIDQYLALAATANLKIKYVIETHLHADFVSGHRELAAQTGAEIVFGAKAGATFPHLAVKDGDEIKLGKVLLKVLETPGHTPESISITVIDTEVSSEPQKVLTGDTLFIGDVGRPDLVGLKGYTPQAMAEMLYNSLNEKLLKLPDSVEVYPAHGAGSLCGRSMSKETSSTIGEQKKFNYALKPMSKDDFVKMMTADLPEVPAYFPKDAEINRTGAKALAELPNPLAMTPEEVNKFIQQGYLVLDIRPSSAFGAGHVPGSLNIALNGQFASWAGTFISLNTPIILVAEDLDNVREAITRLARVGIENVKGYLDGQIFAWDKANLAISQIMQISVDDLSQQLKEDNLLKVIDVRRPAEYQSGHAPTAINSQLAFLERELSQFDSNQPTAVICASGYRSAIAASLLARHGFSKLYNVVGGTTAWINAAYQVEKSIAASN